eukprot:m.292842 g.292842  ORF g.292842 m.292842 type:complete len:131 (+) comp27130_c2_seq3:63-455(+)
MFTSSPLPNGLVWDVDDVPPQVAPSGAAGDESQQAPSKKEKARPKTKQELDSRWTSIMYYFVFIMGTPEEAKDAETVRKIAGSIGIPPTEIGVIRRAIKKFRQTGSQKRCAREPDVGKERGDPHLKITGA